MDDAGRSFMEQTNYRHAVPTEQQRGIDPPEAFLMHPDLVAGHELLLPPADGISRAPVDLLRLVTERSSLRTYAMTPFSLGELSFLLWCTQGVKGMQGDHAIFRTVPSAGARHAFETYLLVNRVDGIDPGMYQYVPQRHAIAPFVARPGIAGHLREACRGQAMITTSACTFIWSAVARRMTWRYGQRGYRYLHLDAGHVCQNLYLAAEAIGAGACAIGAYDDDALNALLDLDGEQEFVIYIGTAGKR